MELLAWTKMAKSHVNEVNHVFGLSGTIHKKHSEQKKKSKREDIVFPFAF